MAKTTVTLIKGVCLLATCLLISACALTPSPSQFRNADYGPEPDPAIVRGKAMEIFNATLFDPYSAKITFSDTFTKGYMGNFIEGARFGWYTCGTVNAKNRFGGYTGAQPFFLLVNNNEIISHYIGPGAQGRCKQMGK